VFPAFASNGVWLWRLPQSSFSFAMSFSLFVGLDDQTVLPKCHLTFLVGDQALPMCGLFDGSLSQTKLSSTQYHISRSDDRVLHVVADRVHATYIHRRSLVETASIGLAFTLFSFSCLSLIFYHGEDSLYWTCVLSCATTIWPSDESQFG
jgi:hypothetical protein